MSSQPLRRLDEEPDPDRRRAWTTFVVVGGGPTGVEMAGAIAEMANHTLRGSFRSFDPAETVILLVEMVARVLATFPRDLSDKAEQSLTDLGVTVRTNCSVVDIQPDQIVLQSAAGLETVPACTVVWAAGVRATDISQMLAERTGAELDRGAG